MKKFNFKLKDLKFRKVDIQELDDRMLLVNLYMTQGLVLLAGAVILFFQKASFVRLFAPGNPYTVMVWGTVFALLVLASDLLISRWVPPEVTDDGGVNQRIFGNRPLWHIALLSLVVSVCEEVLFRGAIQHAWGPYWTSILFAAIHIRYLQHWLMTGLVFGISYGLGWIYLQTGSLWTPILAHFLIDFVMGCILRYRREE
ncbi:MULTISPECIES: type II CAAX endopeptidase family protein [Paenibacillus]|uniref:type II CAAX endopeptidase family protein n=1 Tax=Paenibacillus TaxID=44249 RepID=UPI0022B925F9|nr:type II CAAX endopeptidase family protein [Paenibacillus caseinilyticus]MCZ8520571.1 type II CAAX endopeptidase family protein [Paenibacillus caseinilyticus]